MRLTTAVLLSVIAAGAMTGCDSDGEEPGDGRGDAPPADTSESGKQDGAAGEDASPPAAVRGGRKAVQFLLATNNACLQAAGQGGTARPPRNPSGLRRYARRAQSKAGFTLAALRSRRPPPSARRAVRELSAEYQQLLVVYRQAATVPRSGAETVLGAVRSREQSTRALAVRVGLGGCAPGVAP